MKKLISVATSISILSSNMLLFNSDSCFHVNAAPSMEVAIDEAIKIANDDSHGYGRPNHDKWRDGPDYDCSALVLVALEKAGFDIGAAFNTMTMRENLTAKGFEWITPYDENSLKRGDILLDEYNQDDEREYNFFDNLFWGHTELYIGNGKCVGAHGDKDGRQGDSSGEEINIGNNWRRYDGVLRYTGNITCLYEFISFFVS